MKQVVILAGGKGTRLRERLGNLPKPLIDLCGMPLLERQILLAKQYGITRVLILVNHASDQIIDFCARRDHWGMDIRCVDDGIPRGTAGATLAVFDHLADEFLVMYGDTMLAVDLERFYTFHAQSPDAAATLLLHPNDHPHDSDLVAVDDAGHILGFHPYPHDPSRDYPNLVNAALYWIRKSALAPWRAEQGMLDFAKDLFPRMLGRGNRLRGYKSPEYIKDIGTPERLDRVCADFRSGKIERARLDHPQAMVFIDRDGTINREVNHLHDPAQLELLEGAGAAIRKLNASSYRCCVITNQPVIARGECSVDGMRAIHNRLETLLGRQGAYLDHIYYCPHHPDSGFPGERRELKVDCDCRKPATGMIDRAAIDFNIERGRSWLIGDSSTDIETARRAGLKSVLVETGYAGLDYRWWAVPDATAPDLAAAVSYILDDYPRLFSRCAEIAAGIGESAIVLIGGQSRSGKSTFASVLRDALRASGKSAQILAIDRWLRNERERKPGVLGRYDLAALQALLDGLGHDRLHPRQISLAGYHKTERKTVADVETIELPAKAVVLIEGTVALALKTPESTETHRFHVEIDEIRRRQRLLAEYRVRGEDASAAMAIYRARRQDEFPVVEDLAGTAQRLSFTMGSDLPETSRASTTETS